MKKLLLLLLILITSIGFSQEKISKKERKIIADSILNEGIKLYNYEKSAWESTDLVKEKNGLLEQVGGYLTYENQGKFRTVYYDKVYQNVIAEFDYSDKFKKPDSKNYEIRSISKYESRLNWIKDKIIENAMNDSLPIIIPEKTNLNLILFPETDYYKLYVLTGPTEGNALPFGNDYLITAKSNGEIIEFKKFHSRYLPMDLPANFKQMGIKGGMHSHIKTTPHITATDICIFLLYGELYGINEYTVIGQYPAKIFRKKRKLIINNEGNFEFD